VLYRFHVTGQGYSPHRLIVNGTDIKEIRYSDNRTEPAGC
jgi:hypothetical protein